ncbi:MAG: acetylesterase [Actinomycetota bacterium]|nr:acetylesterase [Actinomycetota bacterium]
MADQLGSYADWPGFALARARLRSPGRGPAGGVPRHRPTSVPPADRPVEPRVERAWTRDGVDGEEVSWSVGFGPRTRAWLLRPAGAEGPLPGALALHGHDDVKFVGKEKIADGPDGTAPGLGPVRAGYGDRAFANALAREGFAVLVPDVFSWGSRRFDREAIDEALGSASHLSWVRPCVEATTTRDGAGAPDEATSYERVAALHEDVLERLCRVLGTSLAEVVAYEDGIALGYLRSRTDWARGPVVAIGCSGGGARAALLSASSPGVDVVVVVGMMSTYRPMVEQHVATHTWMLFPPYLAPERDWPDVVLLRAPAPLLVQYALDDALFPREGMLAAHRLITDRYESLGRPGSYVGQLYDGGHRFDRAMQDEAFRQVRRFLDEGARAVGEDRPRDVPGPSLPPS